MNQPMPGGLQKLTFTLNDGTPVGVIVNWSEIRGLAYRAQNFNRSRTSKAGPITVVLPKEKKS